MVQTRTAPPELPGFTHVKWLGGGGFADVFQYRDHTLGRDVAIKVLRHFDDNALAAFQAEASVMARLSGHPNVVSVFQIGALSDGRSYIVMEMCGAPNLGARVSQRLYTSAKAMDVGIRIAGAVETAHRLGILHRDIKPANILFTNYGQPALADFGIAMPLAAGVDARNAMSPLWAPLEQFGPSPTGLGPWTDVYSLAATLWASMVGRSPVYSASEPNDTLHIGARLRTMPLPRTGRADVPEELERVLAVAMAKDPRERFQSALEFARALQGVQGAMNQSVTPIDVLSEQEEHLGQAPDEGQEGTRVAGFRLIDPEQIDSTSHATGPSSGLTTPLDRSGGFTDRSAEHAVPDGVLRHGRGVAAPGLRDFTRQPAPDVRQEPTVDVPQEHLPQFDPAASSKQRPVGLIVGLVVLLVLLGGAGAVFLLSRGPATTGAETATPSPSARPVDPLAAAVPKVVELEGKLAGDDATFTWVNPEPQDGDQFSYGVLDPRGETVFELTSETSITVNAMAEGDTCLEVRLVRANGRASEPVTGCAS